MESIKKLQGIVKNATDKLESTLLYEGLLSAIEKVSNKVTDLSKKTDKAFNEVLKDMQRLYEKHIMLDNRVRKIEKRKVRDGKTPIKGKDYFTTEEVEEVRESVKEVVKKEVDEEVEQKIKVVKEEIKPEVTPVKGEDYFTETEIVEIKKEVTPVKGVDYRDGKDGETKIVKEVVTKEKELSGEQYIEKIENSRRKLDASAIKNLPDSVKKGVTRIGTRAVQLFTKLLDTPDSIEAGKYLKGSDDGLRLEFGEVVGGSVLPIYEEAQEPQEGLMYINSISNEIKVYYSGVWRTLHTIDVSGEGIGFMEIGNDFIVS